MAEPSCLTELPQPLSCLPSEDQPFVVFLQRAVEGKEVVGVFLLSVFSNAQHPPPQLRLSAGSPLSSCSPPDLSHEDPISSTSHPLCEPPRNPRWASARRGMPSRRFPTQRLEAAPLAALLC